MSKKDNEHKKELLVTKIKNGVVIDRIPPGRSLKVLSVLGIDDEYPAMVALAIKVPSKKREEKLKDVLKIAEIELTEEEKNKLGLVIPGATYNIIRDFEVYKKEELRIPQHFKGILKCQNPKCITNFREPITPEYEVISTDPLTIRCIYCERFMGEEYISQQLFGR